jgi:hypothetical protein
LQQQIGYSSAQTLIANTAAPAYGGYIFKLATTPKPQSTMQLLQSHRAQQMLHYQAIDLTVIRFEAIFSHGS